MGHALRPLREVPSHALALCEKDRLARTHLVRVRVRARVRVRVRVRVRARVSVAGAHLVRVRVRARVRVRVRVRARVRARVSVAGAHLGGRTTRRLDRHASHQYERVLIESGRLPLLRPAGLDLHVRDRDLWPAVAGKCGLDTVGWA